MVELQASPYDYEGIPWVHASVVSVDAELSEEYPSLITAHAVPPVTPPTTQLENNVEQNASSLQEQSRSDQLSEQLTGENETQNRMAQPQQTQADLERERGAGAAGAVIGLFLGGPFLALVFGFGTAYYTKKGGPSGDMARAIGDVALVARDKFREVDNKHHIADKGKVAVVDAMKKIQEVDRNHHVYERFHRFLSWCWNSTLEFAQRHNLMERVSASLKILLDKMAKKIVENQNQVSAGGASTSTLNETGRQQTAR